MKVILYKWPNVVQHTQNDIKMLEAFERFKVRIDQCDWATPSDIMKSFRTADTITCLGSNFNRVCFNVAGN